MPDVIMVADLGSSGSKFFVQVQMKTLNTLHSTRNSQPQLILMEPEVIPASRERLELYEKEKLGHPSPEDSAWVEYDGQCYTVGYLAKSQFRADSGERELKYERVIPKILAALGSIAEREGLPSRFSLRLGVLLPYGEYKNQELLEQTLPQVLSDFKFRHQHYAVELERFECKPEGGGLLLVRRRILGEAFAQQDALIIVMGYRNTSYLAVQRGTITGGSSDHGFIRVVEKVLAHTSGQERDKLVPALYNAGKSADQNVLKQLAKSHDPHFRKVEVAQLVKASKLARRDVWASLVSWFRNHVPLHKPEAGLTGGTANYYQPELEEFLAPSKLNWYEELEKQAQAIPCNRVPRPFLKHRITDAFGFFLYLVNIPSRMAKSA